MWSSSPSSQSLSNFWHERADCRATGLAAAPRVPVDESTHRHRRAPTAEPWLEREPDTGGEHDLYGRDHEDQFARRGRTGTKPAMRLCVSLRACCETRSDRTKLPPATAAKNSSSLADCPADTATKVLERLRERLALTLSPGRVPGFTVSFGIASFTDAATFDEVVAIADAALLTAKKNGRNRTHRAIDADVAVLDRT